MWITFKDSAGNLNQLNLDRVQKIKKNGANSILFDSDSISFSSQTNRDEIFQRLTNILEGLNLDKYPI